MKNRTKGILINVGLVVYLVIMYLIPPKQIVLIRTFQFTYLSGLIIVFFIEVYLRRERNKKNNL